MQEHFQVWKDGQGAKVNLCEEVMPGLVLNQIKKSTEEMDEKGRSIAQKEGRGLNKGPEAWKNEN